MIRHGGMVALWQGGAWRGVLIEGPSGCGKSDLALRALGEGFRLVADDRVLVWTSGGQVWGRAPDALAGLMESRGVGVLPVSTLPWAPIALAIRCVASPADVERWPGGETLDLAGVAVPLRPLWPFDPAAPAKLRRSIECLGAEH